MLFILFHYFSKEVEVSFFTQQKAITNTSHLQPIFSDWFSIYGEKGIETTRVFEDDRNTFSSGKVWILCSTFSVNDKRGSNGGAICFTSSSDKSKMLVEQCSFHQCSCGESAWGGAIFFGYNGECVLSFVCGFGCSGAVYGLFSYIEVDQNGAHKNQIFDSTIAMTHESDMWCTLDHWYGNFLCSGVNVSNNIAYQTSGVLVFNAGSSSFSFCSFRQNIVTTYSLIYCQQSSSTTIRKTNIIENTQEGPDNGLIYAESTSMKMIECSILGNTPNKGKVFSSTRGRISCDSCSIDINQNQDIITMNPPEYSSINYYDFLNLGDCQKGIDSWNSIFPVLPTLPQKTPAITPLKTPEKTPNETPQKTIKPRTLIYSKNHLFRSATFIWILNPYS